MPHKISVDEINSYLYRISAAVLSTHSSPAFFQDPPLWNFIEQGETKIEDATNEDGDFHCEKGKAGLERNHKGENGI